MKQVLIIGLGLIGGSYARGLTEQGYSVSAIDPNQSSITYALDQGYIQEGATCPDPALIAQAELLVFGLYPEKMVAWLEEHQKHIAPGAILTDVCGVKSKIVAGVEGVLREDLRYVGAHPMAGKEVSGVSHADPAIFRQANFILTPGERSDSDSVAVVEQMARDLGFRQISHLSPQDHDRAIGFLSQLTHVIAVSLMNCHDNQDYVNYTGNSFRDLTRIAMINENLWSQLFFQNKEILVQEIDQFVQAVEDLKSKLIEDKEEELKALLISSTNQRMKYIKQDPKQDPKQGA